MGDHAASCPVTYINSAASIKAFVGERGGTVCTSSNAAATLKWAFARGEKVLFLPDQHLGRNTAYKMGIPLDEMVVWDPNEIFGGLDPEQVQRAKMILWKGHCSVHDALHRRSRSRPFAQQHPGIRVIVHPEVPWDVVQAADDSGSTEYIIKTVTQQPGGLGVGRRHRGASRQPPRARGGARPDRGLARSVRLPLLDDVPRVAESPALDSRRAGRGARPQPDRRAGRAEALEPRRARSDAVDLSRGGSSDPPSSLDRPSTALDVRFHSPVGGRMAHELPKLPYDFAALEPHIDAQTMQIHHGKHHQAYVTNLNAALEKHPELQAKSIDDLCRGINSVPEDIRTAVRNNGGGHWNHSMFWTWMAPNAGGAPTGKVADAINGVVRQLRRVQGAVGQGRRRPLRQRLGVAAQRRRQAVDHQHAEPGQSADGRQERRSSASTSGSTPTT